MQKQLDPGVGGGGCHMVRSQSEQGIQDLGSNKPSKSNRWFHRMSLGMGSKLKEGKTVYMGVLNNENSATALKYI